MGEVVDFARLVVVAMVPYVLAGQGTVLAGRAGVFNVAQEGIMLLGASVGFVASQAVGSNVVGVVVAALAGAVIGWMLAWLTTSLNLDQFVVGLALFFLGLGVSGLVYKVVIGVTLQPPLIPTLDDVAIPGLASIPVIGPVLFDQDLLVYFMFAVTALLYWLLYHTNVGLKLRAVGESPQAADSLGVGVGFTRTVTTTVGSALIAVAGAYLPMAFTGTFTEGIVSGRGWLVIALAFFGGWRPHLVFVGGLFFALMEALGLRLQVQGVGVAHQLLLMLPYLATLVVMMFAFRWARLPGFLGRNYDRESRTDH